MSKEKKFSREPQYLNDENSSQFIDSLSYYNETTPDFVNLNDLSEEDLGHQITIQARIKSVRRQGKIAFADIQGSNPNNILQTVLPTPAGEKRELFKSLNLKRGSIIKLQGSLVMRPEDTVVEKGNNRFSRYEFQTDPENIEIVINPEKTDSSLNWKGLVESGLLTPEFYGEIIRMPEFIRVQKLRDAVGRTFINHFLNQGFTEIDVPALTQSISESGAEVFKVSGKAGELTLNQSPQQVKQIMAAIFEGVVTKGRFFRDDPSFTAHHLAEFTGLDMEMQLRFGDKWQAMGDVMKHLEFAVRSMVLELENHKEAVEENGAVMPEIPDPGIPILDYNTALGYVQDKYPDIHEFNRKAEGYIAELVKTTTNSDFYFIVGFPDKDKPFYTDTTGDGNTYSFDLIYRGVEISSGGLRINDPDLLRQRLVDKGFTDLDQFQDYLDTFSRGTPQTGGFGLGMERFIANSLGGINVRLTTLFPKTAKSLLG